MSWRFLAFCQGSATLRVWGNLVGLHSVFRMASNQQTRAEVGALAKDTEAGLVGVVMGDVGGRVLLRPIQGGKEWEALPGNVKPLTAREELRARLAARNETSRCGH